MVTYTLNNGDKSADGTIEIVDQDRLCYLVKNKSKGAYWLRTISKRLVDEFVQYVNTHPDVKGAEAKDALSGRSDIDKFEYGYNATLVSLANIALRRSTGETHSFDETIAQEKPEYPLQQIFYGAPGTGKSHSINCLVKENNFSVIRTTFHPDTDYSTFVGAYKPTMVEVPLTAIVGTEARPVTSQDGRPQTEKKIEYSFVPQSFLHSYVSAWKKMAAAEDGSPEAQILVIEEINRGNCAQIFGDLFQLLDRADSGFSEYPIVADTDMRNYLAHEFSGLAESLSEDMKTKLVAALGSEDAVAKIFSGEELLLPNNLFIWATMNTSDQSLFPIDSAFKRRWDWQYVPISDAGLGYAIKVRSHRYSWWSFIQKVNAEVYKATFSEDKQLGYFFCKANKSHDIDADTFVGKVVFYLWNDVFKDYEFASPIFRDGDNGKLTFDKFYIPNGTTAKVAADKVEIFLQNLGVEMIEGDDNDADEAGGENTEEPQDATETDNIQ